MPPDCACSASIKRSQSSWRIINKQFLPPGPNYRHVNTERRPGTHSLVRAAESLQHQGAESPHHPRSLTFQHFLVPSSILLCFDDFAKESLCEFCFLFGI